MMLLLLLVLVQVHCIEGGAPRRCGGLGDFLCGTIGIVSAWTDSANTKTREKAARAHSSGDDDGDAGRGVPEVSAVDACHASAVIVRRACKAAFAQHKRGMTAPDVLDHVAASFDELCPWDAGLTSAARSVALDTVARTGNQDPVVSAIAAAAATSDDSEAIARAHASAQEGAGDGKTSKCPYGFGSK